MLGDDLYGAMAPHLIGRHALHALTLRFSHPRNGETVEILSPLPLDMRRALAQLRLETTLEAASPAAGETSGADAGLRHLLEAVANN